MNFLPFYTKGILFVEQFFAVLLVNNYRIPGFSQKSCLAQNKRIV